MKKTKPIQIIIKDDVARSYDFCVPSVTSAEDIAAAIANLFKTSLPEGIQQDFNHKDQMTFAFAG